MQIDLRSHPSGSTGREGGAPPARDPSPLFTLQKHIIHLFTHLSVLRAAGIVRLIELPEACAAGYHARRSPYFSLSDARRRCAGCVLFIAAVSSAKRQPRRNPLTSRPTLNDLSDVT